MNWRRRPEGHARVDVVQAESRRSGGEIGHARLHADPVALAQVLHLRADVDHDPGGFVAEDHGRLDDKRADPPVRVIMHVAAADSDRVDCDLHVVRTHLEWKVDVAQRQTMLFFEDQGAHESLLCLAFQGRIQEAAENAEEHQRRQRQDVNRGVQDAHRVSKPDCKGAARARHDSQSRAANPIAFCLPSGDRW